MLNPSSNPAGESRYVLQMRIDATSYDAACGKVLDWARAGESRSVFCANVHMVMQGFDHAEFRQQVNRADLVTSDGVPLVWALRGLGVAGATRVYGPALTELLLARASAEDLCVGFLGGSPETLERLLETVRRRHPGLRVGFAESPPFRPLSPHEDAQTLERIRLKGVRILFVGLGCPKQEVWISTHQSSLGCVALAVGAAFDFLSGGKPQAPAWMQTAALEWLFRLMVEPGRLWRRYFSTNPRFLWHFGSQLLTRGSGIRGRQAG
jgi:N-acetylglucosaminyldiphosphoundecaprenol N-acetyl-beta-D-mannosaminyltransferase